MAPSSAAKQGRSIKKGGASLHRPLHLTSLRRALSELRPLFLNGSRSGCLSSAEGLGDGAGQGVGR